MATDYPSLEVIVCDDGSTDSTVELARRYPFEVLALPFIGLSAARNAALAEATGDIVASLDADAACHPDWPYHLALSMEDEGISATGGPNLPFPGAGFIERAVALSPGAPAEVLLTDTRAEHVPGCNMAFRKKDLEAVGAFNPEFTSAGDDVDVCWKILDSGREIGFTPAAQVIHRRRDTVRGYLRQQRGYGRAGKGAGGSASEPVQQPRPGPLEGLHLRRITSPAGAVSPCRVHRLPGDGTLPAHREPSIRSRQCLGWRTPSRRGPVG